MLSRRRWVQNRFIPCTVLTQVPDQLKTNYADECYNPDGIVPRAVSMIKERFPDSIVCTDVALDPYSDQGHDGVVKDGKILNDETIMQLTKQVRRAALPRFCFTSHVHLSVSRFLSHVLFSFFSCGALRYLGPVCGMRYLTAETTAVPPQESSSEKDCTWKGRLLR